MKCKFSHLNVNIIKWRPNEQVERGERERERVEKGGGGERGRERERRVANKSAA